MKRTNEEVTLNNWKRDETEMNSMEKGETRNNKVGKVFQLYGMEHRSITIIQYCLLLKPILGL